MITIDATVGGASANAYGAVADITDYSLTTIWAADWAALEDTEDAWQSLAVRAARALDTMAFSGYKTDDDQARAFPRTGVSLPSGASLDSTTVPQVVLDAWAHIACYLASVGTTVDPFTMDDTAKLSRLGVGPISMDFRQSTGPDGALFLSTVIRPMLVPYGIVGAAGTVRLVR